MHKDAESILISKEEISKRVKEIAKKIDEDYLGKNPLMVCILRGSVIFFADLVRELNIEVEMDFMAISSYGSGSRSSGEVRMIKDLNSKIEDRHVIIVEDIIDSGYTLTYLKKLLLNRGPLSVSICALLDKPERREVEIQGDYVGFSIENKFVIGYGLDYNEQYRNIPEICVLKESVYNP